MIKLKIAPDLQQHFYLSMGRFMRFGCFGCCFSNIDDDADAPVRHGLGVGRIKYAEKTAVKPQPLLAITNGDDGGRDRPGSVYEAPTYVVEASVVTVSGLQPVQVFEGTIFHEKEQRGLNKKNQGDVAIRRKRRQQDASKANDILRYQNAALQLLRCGQMLFGSGQEDSAGIMFERSLQLDPNSILSLWSYGIALEARGDVTAGSYMVSKARALAAKQRRAQDGQNQDAGPTGSNEEEDQEDEREFEVLIHRLQQQVSYTQMPVGYVSLTEMGDAIWESALASISASASSSGRAGRGPSLGGGGVSPSPLGAVPSTVVPSGAAPTPPLPIRPLAGKSKSGLQGYFVGGAGGEGESPPDSTRPTVRAQRGGGGAASAAVAAGSDALAEEQDSESGRESGREWGWVDKTAPASAAMSPEEAREASRRAFTAPLEARTADHGEVFPMIREQELNGDLKVVQVPLPSGDATRNIAQGYVAEMTAERLLKHRGQR